MNIARILMGMSCREFSEHTSEQHEQPAGWAMRLRMVWHRLLCVYCRRLAQQWQSIRRAIRSEPVQQVMPEAMREKIRSKIG